MIHNPHIPGAFKCDTRYIILYVRQQSCCHLQKYWAEAGQTSSTAGQVVLCYHADDLIFEAHGLTQHLQMEMHDPSGGHIVVGRRLLSFLLPPGLGLVMLRGPILLKFLIYASLDSFGP